MAVARGRQAERLENQQLPRRVREVIFPAQHLGDAHASVVDCIAEEERRRAVGPPNDEVANVIREKTLRPMHEVQKLDAAAGGNAEASRRRATDLPLLRALLRRELAASSGIARRPTGGELRFAGNLELEG